MNTIEIVNDKIINSIDDTINVSLEEKTVFFDVKTIKINILKDTNLFIKINNDELKKMNIIFNTIPSLILNKKRLKLLKKDCAIIDLASSPGGVDFPAAKELNLNTTWALALPTKVAPKTAAFYLKNVIDELIEKG